MRTSVKAAVKRMAVRENDAYVNAVWYLTAKCNYVCPYCINESIKKPMRIVPFLMQKYGRRLGIVLKKN